MRSRSTITFSGGQPNNIYIYIIIFFNFKASTTMAHNYDYLLSSKNPRIILRVLLFVARSRRVGEWGYERLMVCGVKAVQS